MSLNNERDCSHSAISCPVPGSVSVPFPGSAPSTATTPLLFSTPLPPNPDPVDLPANTGNYFHVVNAQVRNRGFTGVIFPPVPI
ncbi:hypothetical protein [Bacillus pseudomycoides]|uniref:hypothetical protein n=1 Tax=Bacillus pseudomycoides TaxID=64104 RepID=UPI0011552E12|nr:hypothetical protein [Bacillus pseudomycoides]